MRKADLRYNHDAFDESIDRYRSFEVIPKIIQITRGDALQEIPTRVIEQGEVSLEGNENNSGFSTEPL